MQIHNTPPPPVGYFYYPYTSGYIFRLMVLKCIKIVSCKRGAKYKLLWLLLHTSIEVGIFYRRQDLWLIPKHCRNEL